MRRALFLSIAIILLIMILPASAKQTAGNGTYSYINSYNNISIKYPIVSTAEPKFNDNFQLQNSLTKPKFEARFPLGSPSKGDFGDLFLANSVMQRPSLSPESKIPANGDDLLLQGRYEEALEAFNKSLDPNSPSAEAWYHKGVALGMLGNHVEAAVAFDQAIKMRPSFEEAWNAKGEALRYQGKYNEALDAYNKSLALNSSFAGAWYNKGLVLMELGNSPEAIKAFDNATAIDPTFKEAWNAKGEALRYQGNRTGTALAFDKPLSLNPSPRTAKTRLGDIAK
jgi:tetratricopeptide (TPR) repeat protein